MYYYIYKITNNINNKIYIGMHRTSNIDDGYMGSGKLLKLAIIKYGIQNFTKEILEFCETKQELYNREAEIVNNEFVSRSDTYNICNGGLCGFDYLNATGLNNSTKTYEQKIKGIMVRKERMKDPLYAKAYSESLSIARKKEWEEGKRTAGGCFGNSVIREEMVKRAHSEQANIKRKTTFKYIKHQAGIKNSQFGTYWAYNPELQINKKFKNKDELPPGFIKGKVHNFDNFFIRIQAEEQKKDKLIQDKIDRIANYKIILDYYKNNDVSLRDLGTIFGVGRGIYKMFEKYFYDEYLEIVRNKPNNSNNTKGRYEQKGRSSIG